jgi:hypothetical protein
LAPLLPLSLSLPLFQLSRILRGVGISLKELVGNTRDGFAYAKAG